MHEFAFAYDIFKVAEATAIKHGAKRITEVLLEIGELTLIVPDLLRRSFEMATAGSIAEGAYLNIQVLPGRIRCRECNKISSVTLSEESQLTGNQLFRCQHCESPNTEIIDGKKANVKNIKIE